MMRKMMFGFGVVNRYTEMAFTSVPLLLEGNDLKLMAFQFIFVTVKWHKNLFDLPSSRYGFTLERMVALGFIVNKDIKTGQNLPVTNEYVMSKDALYQIDVAGRRFTVRQSLHPPRLPSSQLAQSREYCPTLRDKSILQAKQ